MDQACSTHKEISPTLHPTLSRNAVLNTAMVLWHFSYIVQWPPYSCALYKQPQQGSSVLLKVRAKSIKKTVGDWEKTNIQKKKLQLRWTKFIHQVHMVKPSQKVFEVMSKTKSNTRNSLQSYCNLNSMQSSNEWYNIRFSNEFCIKSMNVTTKVKTVLHTWHFTCQIMSMRTSF